MSIEQRKQQMQDILKDTVDYYREDPQGRRAVGGNGECYYTTEDGGHCAIGRYMRPEFQNTEFEENQGVGVNGLTYDIDRYLIKDVHGLELLFWGDLQALHDTVGYWLDWTLGKPDNNEHKFTDKGKEMYVDMQDRIARGEYDID